jgi:hypothetical protein
MGITLEDEFFRTEIFSKHVSRYIDGLVSDGYSEGEAKKMACNEIKKSVKNFYKRQKSVIKQ